MHNQIYYSRPPDSGKDSFLKFCIVPSVALSAYFTGKVLAGLWGFFTAHQITAVILGAVIITAGEIYCFRRFVKRGDYFALVLGVFIAAVSIAGSFGAFQSGFVRNIFTSDAYQAAKRYLDNLDKQIDGKTTQAERFAADKQKWNERAARRELLTLNEQRRQALADVNKAQARGGGESNAMYQSFGDMFGIDVNTAAGAANGYIAFILEIVLIFLIVRDAQEETQLQPGKNTVNTVIDDKETPSQKRKKRKRITVKEDDEYRQLTPEKIQQIISDCLTMRHQGGQFDGAPMYSEIGRKYGIRRQVVFRVFKEYYLNPQPTGNGHVQESIPN